MSLLQTRSACVFGLIVFLITAGNFDARALEPASSAPFLLKDGDRIVFVGDTLIERDQRYGYLETILTLENPDKNLTFRNLGWSGDTVEGVSRSGFDPPEAGFKQLVDQIKAARPTVLVIGYGMADSFAGKEGLGRFVKGLERLLREVKPLGARVVFLSPIPHENLGPPLPDPSVHNQRLQHYARAIRDVASREKFPFVPLDRVWTDRNASSTPLTDNGIHLTARGYWKLATQLGKAAEPGTAGSCSEVHDASNQTHVTFEKARHALSAPQPATHDSLRLQRNGANLCLTVHENMLPLPPPPAEALDEDRAVLASQRKLKVKGLVPGLYVLKIDGKTVRKVTEKELAAGIPLAQGPEFEQVEKLRGTINEKNLLFFHRWRPQNITYLFGFRKHEQGNNAVEVPQFDPLVAEKEQEIARLRKPVPHTYELILESEVAK